MYSDHLRLCVCVSVGEDLGDVPDEVRVCLRQMGISATKVMPPLFFLHMFVSEMSEVWPSFPSRPLDLCVFCVFPCKPCM